MLVAPDRTTPASSAALAPIEDASAGASHVHVPDAGLTIAARDGVTIASEGDRLVLTAATEIVLQVGQSTFTLRADGSILLNGRRMTLHAPEMIEINPDEATPPPGGPDHGA